MGGPATKNDVSTIKEQTFESAESPEKLAHALTSEVAEGKEGEDGEGIKDGIDLKDAASKGQFSFRLAVSELAGPPVSTYKFVCCKGKCPGAPSWVGRPGRDGYTRLLFDTIADPFDMHDLMSSLPHVAESLRRALPVEHGFNCSSVQASARR